MELHKHLLNSKRYPRMCQMNKTMSMTVTNEELYAKKTEWQ